MAIHEEKYYQELLKQFLSGNISDADRYVLEKRALDDPFLLDALEGYNTNKHNAKDTIDRLEKQLISKTTKKEAPTLSLYKYGIAASLGLLLIAGLWWTNRTLEQDNSFATQESMESVAEVEEIQPAKIPSVAEVVKEESEFAADRNNQYDSPKAIISTNETLDDNNIEENDAKIEQVIQEQNRKLDRIDRATPQLPQQESILIQEEQIQAEDIKDEILLESAEKSENVPVANVPSSRKRKANVAQNDAGASYNKNEPLRVNNALPNAKIIFGQVSDDRGNAVASASIYDASLDENVFTDSQGFFTLAIDPNSKVLNIDKVGFEDIEFVIEQIDTQNIVIPIEKIFVNTSALIQANDDFKYLHYRSAGDDIFVAPISGALLYESNIKKNIKLPQTAVLDFESVEVRVQFRIDKSGSAQDFQISQSGGFAFDKEAIRVLSSGGKWMTYPPNTELIIDYPVVFSKN